LICSRLSGADRATIVEPLWRKVYFPFASAKVRRVEMLALQLRTDAADDTGTKLGFHPGFGLTATLPELVGRNNAELIFYTSRRVTGEDATRMGLANVCVPQDQVRAAAMKLASEIAECSPLGLLSTRATMRAGLAERVMAATNHELAEQTRLRSTEDFKEGIKATEERRVANFKGR
jgi:enoyl-CoA hydratase/carnithine racemase